MGKVEQHHGKSQMSFSGSVSFQKAHLSLFSKKKLNAKWITLFDDSNDDEYDGDFTEDDVESPMMYFRFKKVTGGPAVERAQPKEVEIERNESWTVEYLKNDLSGKLRELVESLSEDQRALFAEEEDRINILASLESAHAELEGEHK